jgi:hypothetical protein
MSLTSTAQVLLPVPILVAIFRGKPVATTSTPSRLARLAPAVLVALMMAASGWRVVLGHAIF